MKKLILLFIMITIFSGCTNDAVNSLDTELSITAEQIENANKQIQEVLDNSYWKYDLSDAIFENSVITEKTNADYEKFLASSLDFGYDFRGSEGQKSMLVTLPLLYLNDDIAGDGKFHFIKERLVEVYYINNAQIPSSLNDKSTFLRDVDISEDLNIMREFSEFDIEVPFDYSNVIFDKNSTRLITFMNESLSLFDFADNKFKFIKNLSLKNNRLIDYTFINDSQIAVIVVEIEDEEKEEQNLNPMLIIYDTALNEILSEELENNHTAIHFENDSLIIAKGRNLEFYKIEDGGISKHRQILFGHWVNDMKSVDIGSENALVISDGTDLFLFSIESSSLIWRTHIPVESFWGKNYVADLNSDGVPEIYVHDQMGSTIKYYFAENGINAQSFEYGQTYLLGDFDNDSVSEYIIISDDNSAVLYK